MSGFYFRNEKHVSTGSATIPELVGVTVAELAEAIVFNLQTSSIHPFIQAKNPYSFHYCQSIPKSVTGSFGDENFLPIKLII